MLGSHQSKTDCCLRFLTRATNLDDHTFAKWWVLDIVTNSKPVIGILLLRSRCWSNVGVVAIEALLRRISAIGMRTKTVPFGVCARVNAAFTLNQLVGNLAQESGWWVVLSRPIQTSAPCVTQHKLLFGARDANISKSPFFF